MLALLIGHLWDLLQTHCLRRQLSSARRPKKIFKFGELVEASSPWDGFYPQSNLRWLARTQIWAVVVLVFTLLYGLRALLLATNYTEISD